MSSEMIWARHTVSDPGANHPAACTRDQHSRRSSWYLRRKRILFLALLCSLYCAVALPKQVSAGDAIIVTTIEDELNEDGDCALREAIQAANEGQSVDGCTLSGHPPYTVTLQAETYRLTLQGAYEDENNSGDLDIVTALSLVGHETFTTTIDGMQLDRILHVHAGASVTVTHSALLNGRAPDTTFQSGDEQNHGGAIFNAGALALSHVLIADNQAGSSTIGSGGSGGGIHNIGTMAVSATVLRDNQAGSGADDIWEPVDSLDGGGGGGIHNLGQILLSDSVVYDNSAGRGGWEAFNGGDGGSGGGLLNSGILLITHSVISGNTTAEGSGGLGAAKSGDGGGIANDSALTLDHTVVTGNATADGVMGAHSSASGGVGGGIFNRGTMTVSVSSINRNATGDGGSHGATVGRAAPGGAGGGLFNSGSAILADSTVHDNGTGKGGIGRPGASGGYGGGIFNHNDGGMTVTQSTISGNVCGDGGRGEGYGVGGNGGDGGGIFNMGRVTAAYTTVSNNRSGAGGPGYDPSATEDDGVHGQGGGMVNGGAGVLEIRASIVAGNRAHRNTSTADCAEFSGVLRSMGHNLTGIESGCPSDAIGDRISAFPRLGPLADYGGPTWIHSLNIGSPAIDAADTVICPLFDQRGMARPIDGNGDGVPICDIGAFEAPAGRRLRLPIVGVQ